MDKVNWRKRISIVSDEVSPDFSEAVRLCKPLGIDKFDLRLIHGQRIPFISEEDLKGIKNSILRETVTITGVSPGFGKIALEDSRFEWELSDGLDQTFQFMNTLSVRRLTLFTYLRPCPDDIPPQIPPKVVEHLSQMIARCHQAGMEVLIENVPSCWGNTGENLAWIAQQVDVPVVWDPANAPASGGEAFPAGYQAVKDRMALVHLRNWHPEKGYVYLLDGVVDMKAQIATLLQDGYPGLFCIESHRWDDPLATQTNLEQLLACLP